MNPIAFFTALRWVSLFEGLSLLLLFGAMVPKYAWDDPAGVKLLGPIHGGLFVLFLLVLSMCRMPTKRAATLVLLGVVPFGFIPIDRMIRDEMPQPE